MASSKLKEHSAYYFNVTRIAEGPNNEVYLVLKDPFGSHHVLLHKYFEQYGIEAGQRILAYVDQILCSGEICIEPEHPVYKRNMVYHFQPAEAPRLELISNKWRKIVPLQDDHFPEAVIHEDDEPNIMQCIGKPMAFKVERIRKSRLYLRLESEDWC